MGTNGKLTAKKQRLIVAMLATGTISQAADVAGIALSTAYKYQGDQDFKDALQHAENELTGNARRKLSNALTLAVSKLVDLLQAENESVQVRAAIAIIDQYWKAKELSEIEERLTALENGGSNGSKK